MLLLAVLICILVPTLFEASSDHVIAGVVRPRSLSRKAHDDKRRSFWTPEKIAAAKPIYVVLSKSLGKAISAKGSVTNGPPSHVDGSLPQFNQKKGKAVPTTGLHVFTTGKVFWDIGSGNYVSCSAAVVASVSADLIVTAAHCVYDTQAQKWYNISSWVFVPGFSNNIAPYGIWPARNFIVRNAWINSADYNSDVAFVALSTLNGWHIQDYVGAQGIAFYQPRLAYTSSFGYPSNLDSGLRLRYCQAYAKKSPYTYNSYVGQGLSCNMGNGCSGGPWVQNFSTKTGVGYVTSVNSFTFLKVPNLRNGPYFDTNIKSLYDAARSM